MTQTASKLYSCNRQMNEIIRHYTKRKFPQRSLHTFLPKTAYILDA